MENLIAQINEQINAFKKDAEAFLTKNNKAAGARARKTSLELADLMKQFRKESIEAGKK